MGASHTALVKHLGPPSQLTPADTHPSCKMADSGADKEAEAVYKQFGLEGLKKFTDDKLNAWSKAEVKIAVTGQSGSGKSSLINRLRGFTPKDKENPLYAGVGVTQTTTEIRSYEFPSNPLLQICDLPGAGTQKFPIEEYPREMKFGDYDAFVLVTKDRFTENDKRLATMIQTNYNKPYFFCRSKMDATMQEAADDQGADFDADITEKGVRDNCRAELDDRAKEVYLLAKVHDKKLKVDTTEEDPDNEGEFIKREVKVLFPDNKKLKENIINS